MSDIQPIVPVVLCGGTGSRLWPISRESFPKQFVEVSENHSLFEQTIKNVSGAQFDRPLVIASEAHRFLVLKHLNALDVECDILLEPVGRNTAPAVLMAALQLKSQGQDGLMLVVPSDHLIPEFDKFYEAVHEGKIAALEGAVVTFGITPTRPEIGYGYIKTEDALTNVRPVSAFVEKPSIEKAKEMFECGQYLWNSGIFLVNVNEIVELAMKYQPEMLNLIKEAMSNLTTDEPFLRPDAGKWELIQSNSIDYAIIEKCENLACVPFSGDWSDLGDWSSIFDQISPDENGNRLEGEVSVIECKNTKLFSTDDQSQLVGLGLDGIFVAATNDAILVAKNDRSQDVRKVVAYLEARGLRQAKHQNKEYRPWGWFEILSKEDGYQVKRLTVYPKCRLSLQSHEHRSEHWVVVAGEATVVIGNRTNVVKANQSEYINAGEKHRLSNHTDKPLIVIEVQTGDYLGEDDILRYEDDFFRH